jgi:uncharacterized protein (TIGR02145 family)
MIYITTYPLTQRINPMRKLLLTTAAVAAAIGLAVAGEPSFGTFTDTRDGQTYKTVKIGKQTWMAENLNYMTDSSWCYENNVDSCKKYGRLYTWNTAITACPAGYYLPSRKEWDDLRKTIGSKRRINPMEGDNVFCWDKAGKTLKAKVGWYDNCNTCDTYGKGTDDYGFSALPGGIHYSDEKFFVDGENGEWWTVHSDDTFLVAGKYGYWWTATDIWTHAYYLIIQYYDDVVDEGDIRKKVGISVRCVADRP